MAILNLIVPILIMLAVFAIPVCLLISLLKFFELKNLSNDNERKVQKSKAWKILFAPFLAILLILVIWGLIGVIKSTITG